MKNRANNICTLKIKGTKIIPNLFIKNAYKAEMPYKGRLHKSYYNIEAICFDKKNDTKKALFSNIKWSHTLFERYGINSIQKNH